MSDKRQIIAMGITNLTDARYFAAMGVDWMGFDLRREPRISIDQMRAIMDWVEGPQWLVEIAEAETAGVPDEVTCIVHPMDLHPQAWTGTCVQRVSSHQLPDGLNEPILVDLGPDHHALLDQLEAQQTTEKIWVRSDWTTDLMQTVLEKLPDAGIVLTGSSEQEVGVKDYDIVDALFELFEDQG